jgi:predicted ArsR family transcriptional regulator
MESYNEQIAQVSTALADPTRRDIMQHVLDADAPLSAKQVAQHFGIHVNAARMHLDKLVKGGLLKVTRRRDRHGGRPAHLYCENEDGNEILLPSRFYKTLAEILMEGMRDSSNSEVMSLMKQEAMRNGRAEGLRSSSPLAHLKRDAGREEVARAWLADIKRRGIKARLQTKARKGDVIVFSSCPFGQFSKNYPEVVCEIHRCLEEGFLSLAGEWQATRGSGESSCTFGLKRGQA